MALHKFDKINERLSTLLKALQAPGLRFRKKNLKYLSFRRSYYFQYHYVCSGTVRQLKSKEPAQMLFSYQENQLWIPDDSACEV